MVSSELDKLSKWFRANRFSLTIFITNVKVICKKKSVNNLTINISGNNIERVYTKTN